MKKISGKFVTEEHEPVFRSCWECNSAHDRLKTMRAYAVCIWCGRPFVYGKFLEEIDTEEAFHQHLNNAIREES